MKGTKKGKDKKFTLFSNDEASGSEADVESLKSEEASPLIKPLDQLKIKRTRSSSLNLFAIQ
jgi:hypothetical protein